MIKFLKNNKHLIANAIYVLSLFWLMKIVFFFSGLNYPDFVINVYVILIFGLIKLSRHEDEIENKKGEHIEK